MAFDTEKNDREHDTLAAALAAASAELGVDLTDHCAIVEIDDDEFAHLLEDAAAGECE